MPSGNFFNQHDADLIAAPDEIRRLRIVRAANAVAAQAFQDVGVLSLKPGRRRPAEKRVRFMPIEAEKLERFSVQVKGAIRRRFIAEVNRPKARRIVELIDIGGTVHYLRVHRIEVRGIDGPEAQIGDLAQLRGEDGAVARGNGPGGGAGCHDVVQIVNY